MASAHVVAQLPSAALFRFPPNSEPATIPPPQPGALSGFSPLFHVSDRVYLAALDVRVPLTIAAVYAVTAKLLNRYNKSTGRRPWAISQTRAFFYFVVLHNVFLAAYSAWTWIGMLGALRRSVANPATSGWAATIDSVCRLSGAPGLGNGLAYNEPAGLWLPQSSPAVSAAYATSPDRNQPGRMWNEGLAFYGWIFYLSKFYEVLDTFIILAKGKLSSTLQTYHHAGAMMCMWAGMRYMSAPIWMFVFMNSAIHAMMYSYYTFTAFSVRVPTNVKRSLTSAQITQFLVGASLAMSHSFVSYTVPIAAPSARAAAALLTNAARETAAGPASVLGALKDFWTGASASGAASAAAPATAAAAAPSAQDSQAASSGFQTVPCIATTGETFAIWLNVLYLAPLTYLFVKFFITSYLRRSNAESVRAARLGKGAAGSGADASGAKPVALAASGNAQSTLAATIATTEAQVRRRLSNVGNLAEQAGWDAAIGLEKEVYGDSSEAAAAAAPNAKTDKSKRRTSKH